MSQNVSVTELTYKDGRKVESVTLFYDKGETPQIDLLKLFKDANKAQLFSIQESKPRPVATTGEAEDAKSAVA